MPENSLTTIQLCPSQVEAFEFLVEWKGNTQILHLSSPSGFGKTTVLKEFQRVTGAYWLDVRSFVSDIANRHPLAMQDALWELLIAAIEQHSQIIVDDFHLFFNYASNCRSHPRGDYHETVMKAVLLAIASKQTRLVLGSTGGLPEAFSDIEWTTGIDGFTVADYRHLFIAFLGDKAASIDFDSIYQFAPHLNIYRIERICRWLASNEDVSTKSLLDFIQTQGLASNVEFGEVQVVELSDLCGIDDIIVALEDNIIMPLENLQLATQLGLTPKRGVMLAGPPGTGKTTIGRALARRMRGKFFLIDGTVISGTEYFYHRIDSIFQMAIANAPSIVFIDDSDVIFESGREHGLYRYLLTMLDGLESKSANSVCVMMTAMDLGNIPPALVRSGRIELWLEMRLPNATSRKTLIKNMMAGKVELESEESWEGILSATEGHSGADLKRLVQDAKLSLAADITRQRPTQNFETHLQRAAASIRESRAAYAQSAKRAIDVNSDRPRWFSIHPEVFDGCNPSGSC